MANSGDQSRPPPPHLLIIPFPAVGHFFPVMRLAHQLATTSMLDGGLTITFMVTPKNVKYLKPILDLHHPAPGPDTIIQTLVLPLPDQPGLPTGIENITELPSLRYVEPLIVAYARLCEGPLSEWIKYHRNPPVAIMSDVLFSAATQRLAVDLGIKKICFCPLNVRWLQNYWHDLYDSRCRADLESWRLVFNSFEGLDDAYVQSFQEKMKTLHAGGGGRVCEVGPLLPLDSSNQISPVGQPQQHLEMEWLDNSDHVDNSVVYVGFGTQVNLSPNQIKAIAEALEVSRCKFVWAVKVPINNKGAIRLLEGFEKRVAKRGIVTTEWVPQKAILNHPKVGAYLTHGGWNSCLEGLVGGVVMLLWPMQSDHPDNASLLADDLKVAIRVCEGLKTVPQSADLAVFLAETTRADGGYADVRERVVELRKKALNAIQENTGSSFNAVEDLAKQIKLLACAGGLRSSRL